MPTTVRLISLNNFLFVVFPLASALVNLFPSITLLLFYLISFIALALLNWSIIVNTSTKTWLAPCLVIMLLVALAKSFAYNEARYFFYLLYLPVSFYYSMIAIRRPQVIGFSYFLVLFMLSGLLLYHLCVTGFQAGYVYDSIIEGFSSNGYTSILIVFGAFYILSRPFISLSDIAISAFILFLCIFGYGRGSILTAFAILFILLSSYLNPLALIRLRDRPNLIKIFLVLAAIICIFMGCQLFMVSSVFELKEVIENYTKIRFLGDTTFGIQLLDPARIAMNADYMKSLDFLTFIFGNDDSRLLFHQSFNGNPHNSFVNSHRLFGLFYLASISILCLDFRNMRLPAFKYFILISVFFRAFSEPIFFSSSLDFLPFTFFLIPLNPTKTYSTRTNSRPL